MWFFYLEMINDLSLIVFTIHNQGIDGRVMDLAAQPAWYWALGLPLIACLSPFGDKEVCLKCQRSPKIKERKKTSSTASWGSCLSGKGAYLFQVNHGNLKIVFKNHEKGRKTIWRTSRHREQWPEYKY